MSQLVFNIAPAHPALNHDVVTAVAIRLGVAGEGRRRIRTPDRLATLVEEHFVGLGVDLCQCDLCGGWSPRTEIACPFCGGDGSICERDGTITVLSAPPTPIAEVAKEEPAQLELAPASPKPSTGSKRPMSDKAYRDLFGDEPPWLDPERATTPTPTPTREHDMDAEKPQKTTEPMDIMEDTDPRRDWLRQGCARPSNDVAANESSAPTSAAPALKVLPAGVSPGNSNALDAELATFWEHRRQGAARYLAMGASLNKIKETGSWQQRIGADGKPLYKSFNQFVENECEISASSATKNIGAWLTYQNALAQGRDPEVVAKIPFTALAAIGTLPPALQGDVIDAAASGNKNRNEIVAEVQAINDELKERENEKNAAEGKSATPSVGRPRKTPEQIAADIKAKSDAEAKTREIVERTKDKVAVVAFDVVDGVKHAGGSKVVTAGDGTFAMAMATFECRECGHESITVQIHAHGPATIIFNKKREGGDA